mmetsp:Transcript_19061/g.56611  ORF Transcript_19061/g.56611 Transcript_19061/m.56611 type:complete len:203 (+) Transcript_19061:88-696(+)
MRRALLMLLSLSSRAARGLVRAPHRCASAARGPVRASYRCASAVTTRAHSDPRAAEKCEATIESFGPLGASVALDLASGGVGRGLILQRELKYLREARRGIGAEIGETLPAYAAPSPTAADKFDVFLRPPTAKGKSDDASALIMNALEANDGVLEVGDKSSPADIAAALPGLSKSVFKNAVGKLYREGKVVPGRTETRIAGK